jgi:predicted nucleotidyltransferase
MELPLPPDFKEFLALLNSEKIEYLVVGGYAVAFHGYPRPTGDLDLWIAIHPHNLAKLMIALAKFGFGHAGATPDLFMIPGRVVRMGVPPVRIEILSSISGVDFPACYTRRVDTVVDGVPLSVIGRAELIANKIAAGRDKDLNDLKQLRQPRAT